MGQGHVTVTIKQAAPWRWPASGTGLPRVAERERKQHFHQYPAVPALLVATVIDLAHRPVVSFFCSHVRRPDRRPVEVRSTSNALRGRTASLSPSRLPLSESRNRQHKTADVPCPRRTRSTCGFRASTPATFCEQPSHLPLKVSPQLGRQLRHRPRLRPRRLGPCHNRHYCRSHLLGALVNVASDFICALNLACTLMLAMSSEASPVLHARSRVTVPY